MGYGKIRLTHIIMAIFFVSVLYCTSPQIAVAHAQNGSLTGRYTPKVERWRPLVKRYLKHYKVYTKEREGRILNIIKHESGGNAAARNGRHRGLVQFTPSWRHNYSRKYFRQYGIGDYHADNRLSGAWSIRRLCKVYKDGGVRKIKQHWAATYWR